ncbi:MAG: ABC transporter substrate-binding protein [Lachnospira sp.]|nr:ABC transporter substrate-binding protein [Lachnospira sp.]
MKRLKRMTAVFLVMVIAAFTIVGCGKKTANNQTEESTSKEAVKYDVSVAALKGPTAIGMVQVMKNNKENNAANNYNFNIAATADVFTADLIKGDVQIAALPCNAAATLYNKSAGKVQILGINTLGVLYILDTGDSVKSVADLKGKTIYTTGKGTTPEYTLRHLLKAAGLDPDKDVTIEFKSEAAEVAAVMAQSSEDVIAMLPQPYVTTVQTSNSKARVALDVTAEWEKLEGKDSTVVTGVIVVNTEYYKNNKAAVDQFMNEYKASVEYVNANVDAAAELVEEFDIFKAAIAKKAIPNCNITYITGEECKTKVSNYLKVLFEENPAAVGGSMPGDDFYAN